MTADHGGDRGGAGFDQLLRGHRLAAGLTQVELAERAKVGVRTVRDLERGRASRPQRTTVELLAAALALPAAERVGFLAAARGAGPGLSGDAPVDSAARRRPGRTGRGLPPPGELIGRDGEVADLTGLLAGQPSGTGAVITLVGLAGVGKTSLGLTVAHRVTDRFPAGVRGVVITEHSTYPDVLTAVAGVFGVGRPGDLALRLATAPALLMVDAIERSPDAVAEAVHWLTVTLPTLRVIATGRHPIGLVGEQVWPVTPLDIPPPDADADPATVAEYPAAALFLARLRRVRRSPLGPEETGALVRLVRRLGGLPLALELAAARGRVLSVAEILDRYGDRVLDLAGPSAAAHQTVAGHDVAVVTLREAVAASYRLLEPAERAALRRLSTLRNRWSLGLAEALIAQPRPDGPGEPADAGPVDPVAFLDRLLELGLLSVRGTGPFRFRLLDVVRDLATERAAARGELAAARRRHARVFAALAVRTAPLLTGATLATATAALDDVSSDLWAALAHAANDDPHTALRLAAALPRWWRFRGRDVAGRLWLRRLLDDPRTADADPVARAWAKIGLAQLALEHHAGAQEVPTAESALTEFHRLGDVGGELAARTVLSSLWIAGAGHDEARRQSEAALALAERTGRVRDLAVAQNNLAWHDIRIGDLAAARRRLAAVDRLAAQCGDHRLRAVAAANLAEVARLDGRFVEAERLGRRTIAALEELGDPGHRRRVLTTIGLAAAQGGALARAVGVLGELRALARAGELSAPGGATGAGATAPSVDDGASAIVEAAIAMRRDERERAAEWFRVAAQAYAGSRDPRDVVEALIGLGISTDDPAARAAVRRRLAEVCRLGGITLLPRERALLGEAPAELPAPRNPVADRSLDSRR